MNIKRPFGMLFEEKIYTQEDDIQINLEFSDDLQYSQIETSNGEMVPAVEYSNHLSTKTVTAVKTESTDTDPGGDDNTSYLLGTKTKTANTQEETDVDEDTDYLLKLKMHLSTKTKTKTFDENTDKD